LVPVVKRKIKELFGRDPYSNFNPRTIVSEGAAIFGATLAVPSDTIINEEDKPEGEIELIQQVNTQSWHNDSRNEVLKDNRKGKRNSARNHHN